MKRTYQAGLAAGVICGLFAPAPSEAVVIVSEENNTQVVVDGTSATHQVSFANLNGGLNVILDVNITIDFMKCSTEDGTDMGPPLPTSCNAGSFDAFPDEIAFTLVGPGGFTSVDLVQAFTTYDPFGAPNGGAHITVKFDEQAPTQVGLDFVDSPAEGFRGAASLDGFNGEGVLGIWKLVISDAGGDDPLGVFGFKIDVTLAEAQAPVPATALLLGLGLTGLAVSRRRRN